MNIAVNLCGVKLKNPFIAASGTFGFGREYDRLYDISTWGAISVKGLTLKPREGNPPCRIAETPSGMLNSVGLQNPGVAGFIRDELPRLAQKNVPIIANVAGSSEEDYCESVERLSDSVVDMIELNISCPNVKSGGVHFGTSPESAYQITSAVRRVCSKPLMVKLSPNVSDIAAIARAARDAGADALSLINTLTGMAVNARSGRSVLANITGGLSGPAIKPIALRMVWQAASAVKIPVVGMGGIMSGEDAAEFLTVGASAVMVGSANIADPTSFPRILKEFEIFLEKNKIKDLRTLIGSIKTE